MRSRQWWWWWWCWSWWWWWWGGGGWRWWWWFMKMMMMMMMVVALDVVVVLRITMMTTRMWCWLYLTCKFTWRSSSSTVHSNCDLWYMYIPMYFVFKYIFQSHVPEQIEKVLNAKFTDDNHLFAPLKTFPETLSEEERYINMYFHIAYMYSLVTHINE